MRFPLKHIFQDHSRYNMKYKLYNYEYGNIIIQILLPLGHISNSTTWDGETFEKFQYINHNGGQSSCLPKEVSTGQQQGVILDEISNKALTSSSSAPSRHTASWRTSCPWHRVAATGKTTHASATETRRNNTWDSKERGRTSIRAAPCGHPWSSS